MSNSKVIVVIGATGAQGGGLARAILEDREAGFSLRAVTRKPDSEAARALADAGAEIVTADLDDSASLDRAFAGAYGAFCVTNFWETFSPSREKEQARNMAEAAARAGLKHVVWSTLEDTREQVPLDDDRMPTLQGEYKVPHFDAKGEADQYFRDAGVPTTFLRASFYWDNMVHFGLHPSRGEDGVLRLTLPMGDHVLPGIAAEDIGRCAYGIFRSGESAAGQVVGVAGEQLTGAEMAEKMSRALGEEVRWEPVTPAQFRAFGFPGSEDLGNMFQYYQEFEEELAEVRSPQRSRELYPGLQNFDMWLDRYAKQMPVDAKA